MTLQKRPMVPCTCRFLSSGRIALPSTVHSQRGRPLSKQINAAHRLKVAEQRWCDNTKVPLVWRRCQQSAGTQQTASVALWVWGVSCVSLQGERKRETFLVFGATQATNRKSCLLVRPANKPFFGTKRENRACVAFNLVYRYVPLHT
jgi:hypothetical protein